ncbi:MAG: tetratricopeptide repeat protein [Pseudomonadota bacterium]
MIDIAVQLAEARAIQRAGRCQAAADIVEQILVHSPQEPEALHLAGSLAQQLGAGNQALSYFARAIKVAPQDVRNYLLSAFLLEDMQRPGDAIGALQQALVIKPAYAEAHNHIGVILQDQKRYAEAQTYFRNAVQINPNYAKAYNNWGTSLRASGDLLGAVDLFEAAVRLNPDYLLAHYNLGTACLELERFLAAEKHFGNVLLLNSDHAQALSHLGWVQLQLRKFDQAEISYLNSAKLKPGKNVAELHGLATVYWEQGKIEQTLTSYRQILSIAPHDLKAALGALLSLPAIYCDQADLASHRARFAQGLQLVHQQAHEYLTNNDPDRLIAHLSGRSNFYLAYQGLDDKSLQKAYADFLITMLEKIAPQFLQPRIQQSSAGRRLKIGFLSSFFYDCTVGMYFRRWITRLDRTQFEVTLYHLRPYSDPVTQELKENADHFHHLSVSLNPALQIASAVLADDLDILVYPELGMDSTSFLLGALRLAPLQCAGWGHPVTSGHGNIDFFFSSAAMEPADARQHYVEKLVLLNGIGTCYSKPQLPLAGQRIQYGLDDEKTLYLCPQSLFKIHVDTDDLLARIMARDPNGVLVLFEGRHSNITQLFLQRLAKVFEAQGVDLTDRYVLLPSMPHDDYYRVNMLCDVMLDTPHWSGGNTTIDAIACALPIVTLPGGLMRGRQSCAMLRLIGVDELIANDRDDYVDIAVRLGADPQWRKLLARRIASNSHVIFDDETPIRQIEQFFLSYGKCMDSARQTPPALSLVDNFQNQSQQNRSVPPLEKREQRS